MMRITEHRLSHCIPLRMVRTQDIMGDLMLADGWKAGAAMMQRI
jgi:hypothetical protein